MVVTKHAEQRIRERMGINKRAVRRAAQKALDEGAMHSECAGAMKKWLDKQAIAYDRKNEMAGIFGVCVGVHV